MGDEPKDHASLLAEHQWFALTTMTVNGFLVAEIRKWTDPAVIVLGSLAITLFALYLIANRSAASARKLTCLCKIARDKGWHDVTDWSHLTALQRGAVSWHQFLDTITHFPWMCAELSGSLFYSILVIFSWIGLLLMACPCM